MNNLFKAAVASLLLFLAACNENAEPIKTAEKEVFKTQTEALEKAKQVEQVLIDGAEKQRENINAQTQ
ncbi:MAG: hypothetical protein Q8Q40_11640 [Methylococcaceae bacterium]|nr:hypothetical protein [Methylococcaceae bacterium]